MSGALAINSGSEFLDDINSAVMDSIAEPYVADMHRLAHLIADMPMVVAEQNANAKKLINYLGAQPIIKRVFHANESLSRDNYSLIARSQSSIGAILTVELNNSIEPFYDRVPIVKGPGFGTHFTMMCPYMYLAHYDLVSKPGGREFLQERGIDPALLRISCGTEDFEMIKQAFDKGM